MLSKVEEIYCGVPQGSCLGPLSLLIYSNEQTFCLQSSEATVDAADATISYSSKSGELSAKFNDEVHCLEEWLHGNKLKA